MQRKEITIINKLGLHARAAAKLVQTAAGYESDIFIIHNGRRVSGKSIMGIMMLAASKGTTIDVVTSGRDEEQAMADVEALIADRFGEPE
ncbi:MAG: HPr family phosphocarrier protein [Gammaproteobacteria bacterium]|jgi:phosphocarrier protein HPr